MIRITGIQGQTFRGQTFLDEVEKKVFFSGLSESGKTTRGMAIRLALGLYDKKNGLTKTTALALADPRFSVGVALAGESLFKVQRKIDSKKSPKEAVSINGKDITLGESQEKIEEIIGKDDPIFATGVFDQGTDRERIEFLLQRAGSDEYNKAAYLKVAEEVLASHQDAEYDLSTIFDSWTGEMGPVEGSTAVLKELDGELKVWRSKKKDSEGSSRRGAEKAAENATEPDAPARSFRPVSVIQGLMKNVEAKAEEARGIIQQAEATARLNEENAKNRQSTELTLAGLEEQAKQSQDALALKVVLANAEKTLEEAREKRSELNAELNQMKKDILAYNDADGQCPTCKQAWVMSDSEFAETQDKYKSLKERVEAATEAVQTAEQARKEAQEAHESRVALESRIEKGKAYLQGLAIKPVKDVTEEKAELEQLAKTKATLNEELAEAQQALGKKEQMRETELDASADHAHACAMVDFLTELKSVLGPKTGLQATMVKDAIDRILAAGKNLLQAYDKNLKLHIEIDLVAGNCNLGWVDGKGKFLRYDLDLSQGARVVCAVAFSAALASISSNPLKILFVDGLQNVCGDDLQRRIVQAIASHEHLFSNIIVNGFVSQTIMAEINGLGFQIIELKKK